MTEPGEYSSPARTERTSPAKNTAAYPAVATTHTCAAASNHGSDCVELVSSPTGARAHTPWPEGITSRVRVGSARQFTTADQLPTFTAHHFTQQPAGHKKHFGLESMYVSTTTRKESVRLACCLLLSVLLTQFLLLWMNEFPALQKLLELCLKIITSGVICSTNMLIALTASCGFQ